MVKAAADSDRIASAAAVLGVDPARLSQHSWCTYCGTKGDPSADHFIPKALGGSDERENLVTAGRRCNSAKRDQLRQLIRAG